MASKVWSKVFLLLKEDSSLCCSLCGNLLSVQPILYNRSVGTICGRCSFDDFEKTNEVTYRCETYESLAKYIEFPCRFSHEGCTEMLEWGKVSEHEVSCSTNRFDGNKTENMAEQDLLNDGASNLDCDYQPCTTSDGLQLKQRRKYIGESTEPNNSKIFPKGTGIKCSNCGNFLTTPVYICNTGHNICFKCWLEGEEEERFTHCAMCVSSITRNPGLERLAYFLEYPCKNIHLGCTYTGSFPDIKKHEDKCNYKKKCVLPSCDFEEMNLLNHVRCFHDIQDFNKSYKLTSLVCSIYIFNDRVFSLSGTFSPYKGFKFEIICKEMDRVEYCFKLQISDNRYSKISIQDICIPEFFEFEDLVTGYNIDEYMRKMFISADMIQQLFSNYEILNYKMKISRMNIANMVDTPDA